MRFPNAKRLNVVTWWAYGLFLSASALIEFVYAQNDDQIRVGLWMLGALVWFVFFIVNDRVSDKIIERYSKLTDDILKDYERVSRGFAAATELLRRHGLYEKDK